MQAEELEGIDTADDALFAMSTLHPECRRYDSIFEEYFIDGDQSWKVSQYMAMISACAGCFATVSDLKRQFWWYFPFSSSVFVHTKSWIYSASQIR